MSQITNSLIQSPPATSPSEKELAKARRREYSMGPVIVSVAVIMFMAGSLVTAWWS